MSYVVDSTLFVSLPHILFLGFSATLPLSINPLVGCPSSSLRPPRTSNHPFVGLSTTTTIPPILPIAHARHAFDGAPPPQRDTLFQTCRRVTVLARKGEIYLSLSLPIRSPDYLPCGPSILLIFLFLILIISPFITHPFSSFLYSLLSLCFPQFSLNTISLAFLVLSLRL